MITLANLGSIPLISLNFYLHKILTEYIRRYEESQSYIEIKTEIYSNIMRFKSAFKVFELKLQKKELDSNKYPTNEGNQISVGLMLQNFPNFMTPKKVFLKKFISRFWISCECTSHCHEKVNFNKCLEIHEIYSDLDENDKSIRVGGILSAHRTLTDDPRYLRLKNTFHYYAGNVVVCKPFFQFIYNITKKQIQRIQACINEGIPLEPKRKSNHIKEFSR